MRIALIAPPWAPVPPPRYGGTELIVDLLARGLARAGHDVLLCTTGDSTCPVPQAWTLAEAEGVRVGATAPELRHVMGAYDAASGYDIVHDHTIIGPLYAERFAGLKVVTTVQIHGNTSAASIPLALSVASADGRIKCGDLVMIEAMGGGFTWGAALIRW